jgi:hypothetical protein
MNNTVQFFTLGDVVVFVVDVVVVIDGVDAVVVVVELVAVVNVDEDAVEVVVQ